MNTTHFQQGRMRQGFTLIELLVVIAIIGILSSIASVNIQSARVRARDAKRITDLHQIRLALELFFDAHGYYPRANPTPPNCVSSDGWDCNGYRYSYDSASWDALAADLAPYISPLPRDPINSRCSPWARGATPCYSYAYGNVGRTRYPNTYDLSARLEDPNHPERCGVRDWKYYFVNYHWCTAFGGSYTDQMYEASP